jgi:uncharacterized repeat protein (TIGR03803 family)
VLHIFCAQGGNGADGRNPVSGLIMDGAGNLYGTTQHGGNASSAGVVFELAPNPSRTAWTETVLYRFCRQGGTCVEGAQPATGVIMDGAGNLYGTTSMGDAAPGNGVVFKLTANASRTGWTETVLHRFCWQGTPCLDGAQPSAGLIMDGAGNLYGTTASGGNNNNGVLFELVKSP